MRNAAAAFDDDYASGQPVRRAKPGRKTRGAGTRKKPSFRGRFGGRSVLRYAAVGLSASLMIGIMVNALVLQHSRHPAPLFGKAIVLGDAPTATIVTPPASVPPAQTAALPTPPAPSASVPSAPRPHRAANEAPAAVKAVGHDDPIAKLLKTGSSGDKISADKAPSKDTGKTVLATQHALVKLGFVVKPTGTFGPGTKSAIEAFERDQHLPVKGEMTRKVLKQISAESGVAIE